MIKNLRLLDDAGSETFEVDRRRKDVLDLFPIVVSYWRDIPDKNDASCVSMELQKQDPVRDRW